MRPDPSATAASRLYPSRPILAASLAVFRGDRVLLIARAAAPYAAAYSLPGGLVELGESLEDACLREVEEETGVRADIVGFNRHACVIERDGEDRGRRHFVIASFVGLWRAGEGRPSAEAAEVVWAAPDDLDGLPLTPGLPDVLAQARRILGRRR